MCTWLCVFTDCVIFLWQKCFRAFGCGCMDLACSRAVTWELTPCLVIIGILEWHLWHRQETYFWQCTATLSVVEVVCVGTTKKILWKMWVSIFRLEFVLFLRVNRNFKSVLAVGADTFVWIGFLSLSCSRCRHFRSDCATVWSTCNKVQWSSFFCAFSGKAQC